MAKVEKGQIVVLQTWNNGEGQVKEIMFYDENYLPEIKYCIFKFNLFLNYLFLKNYIF